MVFDLNLKAIENYNVRETSPYIQWLYGWRADGNMGNLKS